MKKLFLILFATGLIVQGCSDKTQDDIKELGHDIKTDVTTAARNVDDKVHETLDLQEKNDN